MPRCGGIRRRHRRRRRRQSRRHGRHRASTRRARARRDRLARLRAAEKPRCRSARHRLGAIDRYRRDRVARVGPLDRRSASRATRERVRGGPALELLRQLDPPQRLVSGLDTALVQTRRRALFRRSRSRAPRLRWAGRTPRRQAAALLVRGLRDGAAQARCLLERGSASAFRRRRARRAGRGARARTMGFRAHVCAAPRLQRRARGLHDRGIQRADGLLPVRQTRVAFDREANERLCVAGG